MALRIAEALGQKRSVAVFDLPLLGQFAQPKPKAVDFAQFNRFKKPPSLKAVTTVRSGEEGTGGSSFPCSLL